MKGCFVILSALILASCDGEPTTDEKQSDEQAQALEQAHQKIGMPAITNFQEKRMMKDLYELRDKAISTNAYIFNDMVGCLIYLGVAVGYGLPYATEYTAPTRYVWASNRGYRQTPQAEPNGLFMPSSAEGTWIMLQNPENPNEVKPVYVEPRVVVSPFRLKSQECSIAQNVDVPTKR